MVRHCVKMRKCIVCDTPIPSNTPMGRIVAEGRNPRCNCEPCIHEWLEIQNQNLCSDCKSIFKDYVDRNFGSANRINNNRNNVPSIIRRTGTSGDFTSSIATLGLHWTLTIILVIILAILCVMYLTLANFQLKKSQ